MIQTLLYIPRAHIYSDALQHDLSLRRGRGGTAVCRVGSKDCCDNNGEGGQANNTDTQESSPLKMVVDLSTGA